MIIYLLLGFFIIFVFLVPLFTARKRKQKLIDQLCWQWGKPNRDTYRNEFLIEQFSNLQQTPERLTDQTIADIDMKDVFAFLDRTQTCVGQQYFYYRLLHPSNNIAALEELDRQIDFFSVNAVLREDIQIILSPLQKHDAHYISSLLKDNLFVKPKWHWLLTLDSVLVIAMLVLSIKFHVLLVWLMAPFTVNVLLHLWNKNNASQFVRSFPQLNRLINISGILSAKDIPFNKENAAKCSKDLSRFQKRFSMLHFNSGTLDDVSSIMLWGFELIKALLLIEVHSFLICIDELQKKREAIVGLFSYIGGIDMAISIASVRA